MSTTNSSLIIKWNSIVSYANFNNIVNQDCKHGKTTSIWISANKNAKSVPQKTPRCTVKDLSMCTFVRVGHPWWY